jgi:hypothetical protein
LLEQSSKLDVLQNLFTTHLDSSVTSLKNSWSSFFEAYSSTRKLFRTIEEDEKVDFATLSTADYLKKWRELRDVAAETISIARKTVRSHQPFIHDEKLSEQMMECLHFCAELIRAFDKEFFELEKVRGKVETTISNECKELASKIVECKNDINESSKTAYINLFRPFGDESSAVSHALTTSAN